MSEALMSPIPRTEIDDLQRRLAEGGELRHYPHERLLLPLGTTAVNGILTLPYDNKYEARNHPERAKAPPERLDPEVPSSTMHMLPSARTQAWREKGGIVDQLGRHVHQNHTQFIASGLALPTGVGRYWTYGEDRTVDAAVFRIPSHREGHIDEYEWLFIQRRHPAGIWALPGGHVDPTNASVEAAGVRETKEETCLDLTDSRAHAFPTKPLVTRSMTWNSWSSTTLVLYRGDQQYLHNVAPIAGSDAEDVGWFTRVQIETLPLWATLYATHIDMARTALKQMLFQEDGNHP